MIAVAGLLVVTSGLLVWSMDGSIPSFFIGVVAGIGSLGFILWDRVLR